MPRGKVTSYYGLMVKAVNSVPSNTKLTIIIIIITVAIKTLIFLYMVRRWYKIMPSYTNVSFSPYLLWYEAGYHVDLKLTLHR